MHIDTEFYRENLDGRKHSRDVDANGTLNIKI